MSRVSRLLTTAEAEETVQQPGSMSVSARFEAVLDDGRRLVLLDDRGWASYGVGIWTMTSVEEVEATARSVVGPDEPWAGRTHRQMADDYWAAMTAELRRQGVETDPDTLRRLPHDVVLGDRLRARLADPPDPEDAPPFHGLVGSALVRRWRIAGFDVRAPQSERLRRRRRWYLSLMGVCLVLILLAWNVVRFWSTTAALVMSGIAAVIPPVAAIVANWGEDR